VEFQTPSWRDLKGATNPESVRLLQVGEQNSSLFKGKLGIIVPPLVLTSVLEENTMEPSHLIPSLSNKFQEFDRSRPTVKACTLLRPVLEFLWGVYKSLIQPVIFSVDRSSESQEWADRLHFTTLLPPFQWHYHHLSFYHHPPKAPLDSCSALDLIAGDIQMSRDATERQHL